MAMKGTGPPPFNLKEGEFLVQCPYDVSHQVTNHRMNTHLPKCRRNYEKALAKKGEYVLMMTCKYNSAHRSPAPEILYHEKICSDGHNVVPRIIQYTEKDEEGLERTMEILYLTKGVVDVIPTPTKKKVNWVEYPKDFAAAKLRAAEISGKETKDDEELWDLKPKGRNKYSVDPLRLKVESQVILKYPPGLTKSERKEFRLYNIDKARRLRLGMPPASPGDAPDPAILSQPLRVRPEQPSDYLEKEPVEGDPVDRYKVYLQKVLKDGWDRAPSAREVEVAPEEKTEETAVGKYEVDEESEDDDWEGWVPTQPTNF